MAYIPSECTLQEYENQIYSGSNNHRLYIKYGTTIIGDEANEYASPFASSLKWTRRLLDNGSKTFNLDCFVSQDIELVLNDYTIEDITQELEIKIGTYIESKNKWVYIPLGKYLIQDNPTTDKNKTTYKLKDKSKLFDFKYNAEPLITSKGGKATLLEILDDICSKANVNFVGSRTFSGYNTQVGIYDNTINARVYVSYIAEQSGSIATINRDGNLTFVKMKQSELTTRNVSEDIVESFTNGDDFNVSRVVYESGIIKYEKGNENNDTLYIDGANPYVSTQTQVDNIYSIVNGFNINSFSTGKLLGNPTIDPWDLIQLTYENKIYKTLAQYDFTFNGVFTSKYSTTIEHSAKKENVSLNSDATFRKYAKTEIDNVNGQVSILAGKIGTSATSITTEYALWTSRETLPSNIEWKEKIDTIPSGYYLWSRTKTTYNDETKQPTYSNAVPISGNNGTNGVDGKDGKDGTNGKDGIDGKNGRGVKSIVPQYYLSTSSETPTGGSWSNSQPEFIQGRYIWTRSYVTWDDNTSEPTQEILANIDNDLYGKYASLKVETDKIEGLVEGIDKINKEFIVNQSVDGNNNLYLTNALESQVLSYEVKGNSYQNGTPTPTNKVDIDSIGARNLININDSSSTTQNGLTLSVENGIIKVKGTPSANTTFTIEFDDITLPIGNYYYYVKRKQTTRVDISIRGENGATISATNFGNAFQNLLTNKAFSLTSATKITRYVFFFVSGTTYDDELETMVTSVLCNKYRPYGTLPIEVLGKNLLTYPYYHTTSTIGSVTYTDNGDGSIKINGTSTSDSSLFYLTKALWSFNDELLVLQPGTYTFKSIGTNLAKLCINAYKSNGTNEFIAITTSDVTKTFTEKVTLNIRLQVTNGTTINNVTIYPQLEKGTQATDYEEYKSNQYNIDLKKYNESGEPTGELYEICKIGDTRDTLDIDDLGNVTLTKRIGSVVLNGSEYWGTSSNKGYLLSPDNYSGFANRNLTIYDGYCSHFMVQKNSGTWTNLNYCGWNTGNTFWVRDDYSVANSVANWKTWLSSNNVKVDYILQEPYTIDLGTIDISLFENINHINLLDTLDTDTSVSYLTNTTLNGTYVTKGELELTDEKFKVQLESEFDKKYVSGTKYEQDQSGFYQEVYTNIPKSVKEAKDRSDEAYNYADGINNDITSMKSSFTSEGLKIEKLDNNKNVVGCSSTLDNTGLKIKNNNELIAIYNNNGSGFKKLIATESMECQNMLIISRTITTQKSTTTAKPVISFFFNNLPYSTLESLESDK